MLDKQFGVPHGIRRRQMSAGVLKGHGDIHVSMVINGSSSTHHHSVPGEDWQQLDARDVPRMWWLPDVEGDAR